MPKSPKPFTAGEWKVDDAAAFQVADGEYRFPFTVLDPTEGGSNLGRIEWCVELLRARKRKGRCPLIEGIAVWAHQTRDPGYKGIVFHLPTLTDAITTHMDRDDFTRFVWWVSFCEVHGFPVMKAYPANKHSVLIVNVGSSLSNDIWFE